ncbi:hypothetical protein DEU40_10810 [Chryseobacterium sp. AG844]|nr:hypothetical protein DEU40_10810 [Chryseobacterium sp. AG844]
MTVILSFNALIDNPEEEEKILLLEILLKTVAIILKLLHSAKENT